MGQLLVSAEFMKVLGPQESWPACIGALITRNN